MGLHKYYRFEDVVIILTTTPILVKDFFAILLHKYYSTD